MREMAKVRRFCHGYQARFESNKSRFCRNGGSARHLSQGEWAWGYVLFFAPFRVPCPRDGGFPCSVASLPHNTCAQMRPRRPKEARRCARGHRASRVERGANPGFTKSVPVPCHAPAASCLSASEGGGNASVTRARRWGSLPRLRRGAARLQSRVLRLSARPCAKGAGF